MDYCAAPDDCYLALRGLRTLGVRLRRHGESGLALARRLQGRPEVAHVLHPGLPEHPGARRKPEKAAAAGGCRRPSFHSILPAQG